ncbi:MAG: hypothetical protein IMHGJWDQ_000032 [Candidatus Fervidibacter sp.]
MAKDENCSAPLITAPQVNPKELAAKGEAIYEGLKAQIEREQ